MPTAKNLIFLSMPIDADADADAVTRPLAVTPGVTHFGAYHRPLAVIFGHIIIWMVNCLKAHVTAHDQLWILWLYWGPLTI